jgi:putative phosphoribosyl transferase
MTFQDRRDAGHQLAAHLLHLRDAQPVVLGLPRGGVPVGFEVAQALNAPLDLLMVRKIGAPGYPELALGAVVDGAEPQTVINDDVRRDLEVSEDYIARETARELVEIERRRALYLRGRPPVPLRGRTVIVVDDGIATGATMRVALQALAGVTPARRVLAVPVAPADVAAELERLCDEAVVLLRPTLFGAVGRFYRDFSQTGDAEVITLLDRANRDLVAHQEGAATKGSRPLP